MVKCCTQQQSIESYSVCHIELRDRQIDRLDNIYGRVCVQNGVICRNWYRDFIIVKVESNQKLGVKSTVSQHDGRKWGVEERLQQCRQVCSLTNLSAVAHASPLTHTAPSLTICLSCSPVHTNNLCWRLLDCGFFYIIIFYTHTQHHSYIVIKSARISSQKAQSNKFDRESLNC